MKDIAERLRWCRWRDSAGRYVDVYNMSGIEAERLEAAEEIERLRGLGPRYDGPPVYVWVWLTRGQFLRYGRGQWG